MARREAAAGEHEGRGLEDGPGAPERARGEQAAAGRGESLARRAGRGRGEERGLGLAGAGRAAEPDGREEDQEQRGKEEVRLAGELLDRAQQARGLQEPEEKVGQVQGRARAADASRCASRLARGRKRGAGAREDRNVLAHRRVVVRALAENRSLVAVEAVVVAISESRVHRETLDAILKSPVERAMVGAILRSPEQAVTVALILRRPAPAERNVLAHLLAAHRARQRRVDFRAMADAISGRAERANRCVETCAENRATR